LGDEVDDRKQFFFVFSVVLVVVVPVISP